MTVLASNLFLEPLGRAELARPKPGSVRIVNRPEATLCVQCDSSTVQPSAAPKTERRNLARVGQPDGLPTEQDHREWMAEENPFQASQRPWERADLILCGTPQIPFDRATELVIASPIARSG